MYSFSSFCLSNWIGKVIWLSHLDKMSSTFEEIYFGFYLAFKRTSLEKQSAQWEAR